MRNEFRRRIDYNRQGAGGIEKETILLSFSMGTEEVRKDASIR